MKIVARYAVVLLAAICIAPALIDCAKTVLLPVVQELGRDVGTAWNSGWPQKSTVAHDDYCVIVIATRENGQPYAQAVSCIAKNIITKHTLHLDTTDRVDAQTSLSESMLSIQLHAYTHNSLHITYVYQAYNDASPAITHKTYQTNEYIEYDLVLQGGND